VTHLRKIMLEELERRNYAQTTIDCYLHAVEHCSQYFRRSPDQLGPEHIRKYQAALFKKWKLAPNTVNQRLAALRFFYIQTLKKAWSVAETPYPKKTFRLPTILSPEEVTRLIDSARTPFHRIRAHDALRHWDAARRIGPLEDPRYRQSTNGHSHPRGQGAGRSRCHAQPQALGSFARLLARVKTEALAVVVPRVDAATPPLVPSLPKQFGTPVVTPHNGPVWQRRRFIHTRCAIVSQPTCSKPVPTCAPFSCCWGTTIWKKQPPSEVRSMPCAISVPTPTVSPSLTTGWSP
jgi:hypothetical protein